MMTGSLRDDRGGRTGGQVLLALALTFLLDGCGVMSKLFPAPSAPVIAASEQVNARIEELEFQLRKGKNADPEASLARELALLYVHPANRAPDYGRSLAMLHTYFSLAPPGEEDLETGRLAALLEAIERRGRLLQDSRTQAKALSSQVQALQHGERDAKKREQEFLAQIKILQEQIKTLQEQIEKILALDMEMAKRRRSVR